MLYLLNWRVWALVVLLALYPVMYGKGRIDGRKISEANYAKAAAVANNELRKMESLRQARADEAARAAATREARLRDSAADARRDAGGLRDDLSAAREYAAKSRAAAERTADISTRLLERCSGRYLGVAEAAQRADSEARELRQAWPK